MVLDRLAIICLCAQFGQEEGVRPLTSAEYRDFSALLARHGIPMGGLFSVTKGELTAMGLTPEVVFRLEALLGRASSMEALLESYKTKGIGVLTPLDDLYSPTIKAALGCNCPPVLCYCGDAHLGLLPAVGFVGARDMEPRDSKFAAEAVKKVVSKGYSIVSGGARGIDSVSEGEALRLGGSVVEFPAAVSLLQKLRNGETTRLLEEGKLLLLSPAAPHTGFSNGLAAARNRLIYSHSLATVVVRASQRKGGTWSGATDALKKGLCPVLCRDYAYEGNQGLLDKGAIAIDEDWDGRIPEGSVNTVPAQEKTAVIPEQFSIF